MQSAPEVNIPAVDLLKRLVTIKMLPPQPPRDWVKRNHLMKAFQQSIADRRHILLLAAPVGYGKTTSLQELAKTLKEKNWDIAWLSLDCNDRTPQILRLYILASLKTAGINIEQLQQDQLANPSECNADQFAFSLSEQVRRQGLRIALILDDAHELQTKDTQQELAALCKYSHDHLLVIVSAHTKLPLPTAKLQSQGRLQRFTIEDLQFNKEEAQRLLLQTATGKLSDSEIQQLLEKTAGWPALLNMALEVALHSNHSQVLIDQLTGSTTDIASYLTEEVLGSVSPSQRQALRNIAIAPKLNNELIRAITENDTIADDLRHQPSVGLLIQNLDAQGYWFKIHPLLRDLLLNELQQQPKNDINNLYQRACQWCYEHKLIAEAIGFAIDNQQYDYAMQLLAENGNEIIGKGELHSFLSLVRRLPVEIIRTNPDLLLMQAWHHLLINENKLSCLLQEEVRQLFVDHTPSPATAYSTRAIQPVTYARQERYDKALEVALPLLQEGTTAPAYLRNTLLITIAGSYYNLGKLPEALKYAQQCHLASTDPSETYSAFYARVALIICYLTQADRTNLQREFDDLCQWFATLPSPSQQLQKFLQAIRGVMAYLSGDLKRAKALFEQSEDIPFLMGDPAMIGWMIFFQSRTYSDLGDSSTALRKLQELLNLTERHQTPIVHRYIRSELVRLAQLVGDKDTVKFTMNKWPQNRKFEENECPLPLSDADYYDACALLGRKDYAQLAVKLKKSINNLQDAGYRFQQIDFMLTLAEGYRKAGNDDKAKATLEDTLFIDSLSFCDQLFRSRLATLAPLYKEIYLSTSSPLLRLRMKKVLANYQPTTDTSEDLSEPLSKAELKAAACLQQGMTNKEIADHLFITVNTVKTHLKSIYAKLGVTSRAQAIKHLCEYRR